MGMKPLQPAHQLRAMQLSRIAPGGRMKSESPVNHVGAKRIVVQEVTPPLTWTPGIWQWMPSSVFYSGVRGGTANYNTPPLGTWGVPQHANFDGYPVPTTVNQWGLYDGSGFWTDSTQAMRSPSCFYLSAYNTALYRGGWAPPCTIPEAGTAPYVEPWPDDTTHPELHNLYSDGIGVWTGAHSYTSWMNDTYVANESDGASLYGYQPGFTNLELTNLQGDFHFSGRRYGFAPGSNTEKITYTLEQTFGGLYIPHTTAFKVYWDTGYPSEEGVFDHRAEQPVPLTNYIHAGDDPNTPTPVTLTPPSHVQYGVYWWRDNETTIRIEEGIPVITVTPSGGLNSWGKPWQQASARWGLWFKWTGYFGQTYVWATTPNTVRHPYALYWPGVDPCPPFILTDEAAFTQFRTQMLTGNAVFGLESSYNNFIMWYSHRLP